MRKFSISMNSDKYDSYPVTEELIQSAVNYVREQTIRGNYEFLTLVNNSNNSFIQFVLEQGKYHIEIRYPDKGVFVKKVLNYEEMMNAFYDFYEGKNINISEFEDISHFLK